jgi:hypothetical protein
MVLINNMPLSGVTLAEIRDLIGQGGLLILTAFLAVVFIFPVSIPGVSTVLGAAILLIGICRLLCPNLWLPERISQRMLPALALLFPAIGMLQQDGLCILFGHLANLATIVYFIVLIVGGSAVIREMLLYIVG